MLFQPDGMAWTQTHSHWKFPGHVRMTFYRCHSIGYGKTLLSLVLTLASNSFSFDFEKENGDCLLLLDESHIYVQRLRTVSYTF